jgi:CBS domain-containing membrane protein
MQTEIKNIYSKNLISIHGSATLAEADSLMEKHNIRHLPVVDDNAILVGLLSRSDYVALRYVDESLKDFKVLNFMSSPVKAVSSNSKIKAVAQLFMQQKINSALIIEKGEVSGIVTSDDLIRLLAEHEDIYSEAEKMDMKALAEEGWISSTGMA